MNIRMNYTTRQEMSAKEAEMDMSNIPTSRELVDDPMANRMPTIPLPNVGEGGAVGTLPSNGGTPVTPVPNPGEGGAVSPMPDTGGMPAIPLPNPGEGGATTLPSTGGIPVIPLPNPGEGGAVGIIPTPSNVVGLIATIISSYPRPNAPCNFCPTPSGKTGNVRFLNAASDYDSFRVYINEQLFIQPFYYGEVSEYQKVESGYQMVTISGKNGYVYIQQSILIPDNGELTIAITNTSTGLGLTVVEDSPCAATSYVSCIRVCNLCHDAGDLDVIVGDSYLTYCNVSFEEVTKYKTIWPNNYYFFVRKSVDQESPTYLDGSIMLTSQINVKANKRYTIYLLKWQSSSPNAVRALVIEE
ncbi:MAG: DUF4397 domain-containing protein [Eubacteriales bacterium]